MLDRESQELLSSLNDLAGQMKKQLTILSSPFDERYARVTYVAFFTRAVRIFRAFTLLVQKGYGPEADLLVRPFYEILVDWLYVETNPAELGERYIMHQAAAQLQWLRDHEPPECSARYVSKHGDVAKEYNERYCSGNTKLVPIDWSGMKMRQKSSSVKLENYYPIYGHFSDLLHNSPLVLSRYVCISEEEVLTLKTEPEFLGLDATITLMCGGLIICLQKADEYFDLHRKSDVEALGAKIHKRMAGEERVE